MQKKIQHIATVTAFAIVSCILIAGVILLLSGKPKSTFSKKRSNIILITALSLRPDHLSCYGYELVTSKAINELADSGILFENPYCSVPDPLYSYAAILSGRNGGSCITRKGDHIGLSGSCGLLLSGYLDNAGYTSAAVASTSPSLEKLGLDKGFSRVEDITAKPDMPQEQSGTSIDRTTETAIKLIGELKNGNKPFFLWVEYSLPLYPYALSEDFRKTLDEHPYDGQILLLDAEIGKLTGAIKKAGLDGRTIIIFTAASGESLNEHKEMTHGIFVYDSSVKVPLIMKFPGTRTSRRIPTRVSLVDIVPTVLDSIGVEYNASDFDGQSLLPLITGTKSPDDEARPIYLESLSGYYFFGWSPVAALITDGYKYIELPSPELYDLGNDPHELNNIVYRDIPLKEKLQGQLLEYIKNNRPELSDIVSRGSDPKKTIALLQPIQFDNTDVNKVINYYENMLAKDPDNKLFKYILGDLYYRVHALERAKKLVTGLIEIDPDSNRAWELLGLIHERIGNTDEATDCYEKAISIFPDMPVSLNNLAWRYLQTGVNIDTAREYAEKAVEIAPDNLAFLDTLVEIYIKTDNKDKLQELLAEAAASSPGSKKAEYLQKRIKELELEKEPGI
ncbi:MAG: sulfatase-like hydrolase/transferase [Candidatus Omnitrophota bacterium]